MSPFDDELSQQLRGVNSPMISPDGRVVAYVRISADPIGRTLTSEVVIVNVADRKELAVFPGAAPHWNAGGRELSFSPTRGGKVARWLRSDAATPASPRSDGTSYNAMPAVEIRRTVRDVSIDSSGRVIAFVRSGVTEPPDVYTARLDSGGAAKALTRVNSRVVQEAIMTDAVTTALRVAGGETFRVFVLPPAGAQPGRKYPALLAVRTGAQAQSGYDFSDRFQLLATRGYGVIYVESAAADAATSLSLGLAAAIERNGWIDTARLGVMGDGDNASAIWIASHKAIFDRATNLAGLLWRRDVRLYQYFPAVFTAR